MKCMFIKWYVDNLTVIIIIWDKNVCAQIPQIIVLKHICIHQSVDSRQAHNICFVVQLNVFEWISLLLPSTIFCSFQHLYCVYVCWNLCESETEYCQHCKMTYIPTIADIVVHLPLTVHHRKLTLNIHPSIDYETISMSVCWNTHVRN